MHAVAVAPAAPPASTSRARSRASVLLMLVFAATWFVSTTMAAHLPRLLKAGGATLAAAVSIGALVGPAQVAGRLLEFGLLKRWHPLRSARIAALMHPAGAALLLLAGAPAAAPFAILHGAGNGILTIANGTLPPALFGARGYGRRQGLRMLPARLTPGARALAVRHPARRLGPSRCGRVGGHRHAGVQRVAAAAPASRGAVARAGRSARLNARRNGRDEMLSRRRRYLTMCQTSPTLSPFVSPALSSAPYRYRGLPL